MAEKISVTMEDGRVVEFNVKQKAVKESTVADGVVSCQMDFANGMSRIFTCPDQEMLIKLAMHGAEQKLGDEMAGIKEIDDCVLAVESLIARLEAGEWTKTRSSNGMAGTSVLIAALMEFSGKDVATIKEFLKDKTQAEKLALRKNPDIKVIVDRIEEERLAAKAEKDPTSVIDTDALLAGI